MTSPIRLNSSGAPYLTDLPAPNIAHIAYQDIAVRDIGDTITILYSTKKRELVNGINRIFGTNLVWNELQERAHTFFHPEISSVFISFTFENVGEYFIAQKVTNTDVLPKVAKTAISVYEMATKNARPTEDTVYYTTPKNAGIFTNFLESQFCTQEMLFSPTYNTHFSFVLLPNNDFLTPVILQYHGDDNGYVTLLFKDEIIPAIDLNMSVYNRSKALITLATTLQVPKSGIDFTGQNTIKVFDPITGVNSKYTVFCMKRDNESKYMAVGEAIVVGTPISPPPPPVPTTPTPAPEQGGSLTGLRADYSGTGWYKATDTGTVFCKDVPEGETARFEEGGVVYVSVYTKANARLYNSRAATSNLTDMSVLFSGANDFNQDISSWDVSNVENMEGMFEDVTVFNQDISSWDVGNVMNMSYMFYAATAFNQDISGWNVGKVTNMEGMLYAATVFNQDISGWDVSQVTNMKCMFKLCQDFNQDIGVWDVSKVTDMSSMFSNAFAFNQDISGWDVSQVTDMSYMFFGATNFNQDLSGWNVFYIPPIPDSFDGNAEGWSLPRPVWETSGRYPSPPVEYGPTGLAADYPGTGWYKATDTGTVFCKDVPEGETKRFELGGTNFISVTRQSVDSTYPERAATSNLTEMDNLFNNRRVEGDITTWDVSNVTSMSNMFYSSWGFDQPIGNWNVGQVTDMSNMFNKCRGFNQDISGWDVSQVTDMNNMFNYCEKFNQDLSNWDVGNVTDMTGMFENLETFNQDLSRWNVLNIPTQPDAFDRHCFDWTLPKPVWGTDGSQQQD